MTKSSRSRRRSHRSPHRPSTRPLELAQLRAATARELAGPLAACIEEFLEVDQRLASRRDVDRWLLAGRLLDLVAGWGSLSAGTDDGGRAGRLLAAALIELPDPGFVWWVLDAAELKHPVREATRDGQRLASGFEPELSDDFEAGSVDPPEHLSQHLEDLRRELLNGGARGDLVETVSRDLVEQRMTLASRAAENGQLTDPPAALFSSVAGILLGIRPPVVDPAFVTAAGEMFEGVADAAREGDPGSRGTDPFRFFEAFVGLEEEDEDLDDEVDLDDFDEMPVRVALRRLDEELRFVDDPLGAAHLAFMATNVLCLGAILRLEGAPSGDLLDRVGAAVHVAGPILTALNDLEADQEEVPELADDASIRAQVERACAVLESDLGLGGVVLPDTEDHMRQLDRLVFELTRDKDEEEEAGPGSVIDGFGWAGAAVVAARLAVELSSDDPERQRSFAPVLAVLDPLALAAVHPGLREPAAASLQALLSPSRS